MPDNTNIGSVSELPKVTLLVAGKQDILPQDYGNLHIIQENAKSPAEFFNAHVEDKETYYGFMSAQDNFNVSNAITTIVDKLTYHELISGVYCDSLITIDDVNMRRQFLPSFHPNLLVSKLVFNIPLFCKATDERFNPQFEHMFFYDMWLKLIVKMMFIHVPYPLITSMVDLNPRLAQELQLIHNALS